MLVLKIKGGGELYNPDGLGVFRKMPAATQVLDWVCLISRGPVGY